MSLLKFGDRVLLKFPFTDARQFKKRPAMVIRDTEDGDVLVCRITGQDYKTNFDFSLNDWKKMGLLMPSVIRIHKTAALDKLMVQAILGSLDMPAKNRIEEIWRSLPK
jgi:mRNA interferase MazF